MKRSRFGKSRFASSGSTPVPHLLLRTPLAVAIALACPAAVAQQLEEVIVTAQKRAENMQEVPISIQALDTESLEQLNVRNFQDYVQLLPSVSSAPGQGGGNLAGPGFQTVYMRGVTTGGDGQAITSVPSVGMYLDEQPITTIQGNLDIHMYDIARVEALAGPQGTLYGASSQAGTIRIITNRPDPSGFAAGYGLEGNIVDGDDSGYLAEGFVNVPLGESAAVRMVGWYREDAGWVDNVETTRTFFADQSNPDDDITVSNEEFARDNYNTVETYGARAALRVDLNESWAITPSLMYQKQQSEGSWGDDLNNFMVPGDNAVAHFQDEYTDDEWYQAGLTIEGNISNFDLTYAGNYLDREVDASFDYSDYSYFYDSIYTTGYFSGLFVDDNLENVAPLHRFTNDDAYSRQSHELRLSSPQDRRVRGLIGLFYQKHEHDFFQRFLVEGLAATMEPNLGTNPLYNDVVYLNSMDREDTDEAIFGSISFDITDKLELTAGVRFFQAETTVKGFFGFGLGFGPDHAPCTDPGDLPDEPGCVANGGDGAFADPGAGWARPGQAWSRNGEWRCPSQEDYKDAPCVNVDRKVKSDDNVSRINLNYRLTDDAMLYATWSEGFRPGGINRNPFVGDFEPDFLTNWELGWKTVLANNSVMFNGAVFFLEWDNLQRAFAGANGITQVDNAPSAEITGAEVQMQWAATEDLMLSAAAAYYDSELTSDYVEIDASTGLPEISAPAGTPLPITPEFKANLIARYGFPIGDFDAHLQGVLAYESSRPNDLNPVDNAAKGGDLPSSTILDLSAGIGRDTWTLELYVRNATDEDAPLGIGVECAVYSAFGSPACGQQPYAMRRAPTTISLRFTQDF
jgi:outer membrane receptor protein involved in Fe transport